MSDFRSQLLESAKGFIEAHNDHDIARMRSYLAGVGSHSTHPEPVRGPVRNNEEYIEFETWAKSMLRNHTLTPHETLVDELQRKVIIFLESYGEADVGSFRFEMVVTLTFTEDGKKVVEQKHFYDSKKLLDFMALSRPIEENWQDPVGEAKKE